MKRFSDSLIVVAHPDDETIYFGGLALAELAPSLDVLVLTDGGWGGRAEERLRQLDEAARRLGARSVECWRYPDHPLMHLPLDELVERLRARSPRAVFTHSPHGEYGHLAHMDVSLAAHRAFAGRAEVYAIADRLLPELVVTLDRERYLEKAAILTEVYGDELRRAWRSVSVSAVEGFTRLELDEVEAVWARCTQGTAPDPARLRAYAHLASHLEQLELRR